MNFDGDTRQLARRIVDDFTYNLHHTISNPQIDFTKVSGKELISLIDHIEQVIIKALGK